MWINLVGRDVGGAVVYQSGAYDASTGVLTEDSNARVYEAKLGLSPAFAASLGLPAGPGFHFALNDTLYKDNRIPPVGFTNAAFDAFGGAPVEAGFAAPRYADGQSWDVTTYHLPASASSAVATLYYQTTSKEYIEFLRGENTTNAAGQTLYDAWTNRGRAAPVMMARDSTPLEPLDAPGSSRPKVLALRALANPFRGRLDLSLALPRAARVRVEVLDVMGRSVRKIPEARLVAGEHRLTWDGLAADGHPVSSGAYWVTVWADDRRLVRHVVALK